MAVLKPFVNAAQLLLSTPHSHRLASPRFSVTFELRHPEVWSLRCSSPARRSPSSRTRQHPGRRHRWNPQEPRYADLGPLRDHARHPGPATLACAIVGRAGWIQKTQFSTAQTAVATIEIAVQIGGSRAMAAVSDRHAARLVFQSESRSECGIGWQRSPTCSRVTRARGARRGSRGQGRGDFRWHRHVRALEAAERPERSELNVLDQLRPEQRRADAVVEPDVGPPPEVRGVRWLNGVLVRLRHDRRDVVDARVFRPYDLQPDPVADRHPAPVPRRAPPLPPGRGHRGVQVVVPGVALKDPVSHGFAA